MKGRRKVKEKVRCMLYEKPCLNRKLACLKNSFDEVYRILNPNCKCG